MSQIVTLDSALQAQLEQVAIATAQRPEAIVQEAVAVRVQELRKQLLEREEAAYQELHPSLLKAHLGKFVAIMDGIVVDSDPDLEALYRRVREEYAERVVLVRQVEPSAVQTFNFRGVRME
ncbi:MAG: hypothetical protein KDD73_15010 [Anaerolineales bacterium]|nr:hypothetical protein [Anaerolineales bacterium]